MPRPGIIILYMAWKLHVHMIHKSWHGNCMLHVTCMLHVPTHYRSTLTNKFSFLLLMLHKKVVEAKIVHDLYTACVYSYRSVYIVFTMWGLASSIVLLY